MSESKELARVQSAELAAHEDISVSRVIAQATAVQQLLQSVMKENTHYGVIPGTPKPSLWQPGADYLCMLFRMRADYEVIDKTELEDRIAFTVRCRLYHITAGYECGSGIGSANSREAKYMSQATAKVCPHCKKPAIIKGKDEYGGGWLCYKKKDGCGAKFPDGAKEIEGQSGQILADKVWDLHNTLMKMACKRAKVAAVLTATAASDIFTQDLEDLQEAFSEHAPPRVEAPRGAGSPKASASPAPSSPTTTAAGDAGDSTDGASADDEMDDPSDKVECYLENGEVTQEPRRTDKQNRKLHALFAELEIQEDDYPDDKGKVRDGRRTRLKKRYSKDSTADLSVRECGEIIDALEAYKERNRKMYGWGTPAERRQKWNDSGMQKRADGSWGTQP